MSRLPKELEVRFLRDSLIYTAEEWAVKLGKSVQNTLRCAVRKGVNLKEGNTTAKLRSLWGKVESKEIAKELGWDYSRLMEIGRGLGLPRVDWHDPQVYRNLAKKGQEAYAFQRRERGRKRALELFGTWDEVNSYVFGVLWGDGSLFDYGVRLNVQAADEGWMQKIGNWFKPDIHLCRYHQKSPKSDNWYWYVVWVYGNVELVPVLESLGLYQRKSFINPEYPSVPDLQFSNFARGVLDSDGTVGKGVNWLGSEKFVGEFRRRAIKNWGVSSVPQAKKCSEDNCWKIGWAARADVGRIFENLYGTSGLCLERKRKRVEILVRGEK